MSSNDTIEQLEKKEHKLEDQVAELREKDPSKNVFRTLENAPEDESDEAETGSRLTAIRRVIQEQLKQVRNALHKLRYGSYSLCDRCGKPIEKERLQVMPEATYCVNCERELEKKQNG